MATWWRKVRHSGYCSRKLAKILSDFWSYWNFFFHFSFGLTRMESKMINIFHAVWITEEKNRHVKSTLPHTIVTPSHFVNYTSHDPLGCVVNATMAATASDVRRTTGSLESCLSKFGFEVYPLKVLWKWFTLKWTTVAYRHFGPFNRMSQAVAVEMCTVA